MTRAVALACVAILIAGCAVVDVKPLESAADTAQLVPAERRLWSEAADFDAAIQKSDQVYRDENATTYLQAVMDRLYPEFKGTIRVQIVRSPHLNAFALPNGSIYFHVGLLARLDNEAQLAAVLAHEGAHYIKKHGFQQRQTVKNASAFAVVTALAGIPLLGDVLALSSIYGYSQDLEREADNLGYERLLKAGYDPHEAPKTFEHLAAEVKALDVKEPFFFSSHPKLQERIESFRHLAASQLGGGYKHEAEFLAATKALRVACLESDLSMNRYKSVLLALERQERMAKYPREAAYYLGEAYRLRAEAGDEALAEQHYLKAVKQAPAFAPAYRALGIHFMKKKDHASAQNYLSRYLQLAPSAADAAYVRQYKELAQQEMKKQ
jgi:predicted Zn-dependent protease